MAQAAKTRSASNGASPKTNGATHKTNGAPIAASVYADPILLAMADLATAFGQRVLSRRIELGLTQKEMIEELNLLINDDLGRTAASVWENGHAEPSISVIFALAKVLRTSPEFLAYGVKGVKVDTAPRPWRTTHAPNLKSGYMSKVTAPKKGHTAKMKVGSRRATSS